MSNKPRPNRPYVNFGQSVFLDPARERFVNKDDIIRSMLLSSKVFLFMKGTPIKPECGFSSSIVSILNQLGVPFKSFNVLSSQKIRDGIKIFSNWPLIPQLYVKGQLIGGCDIVTDLYRTGDLQKILR